jgi:hypothetical protein
MKILKLLDIIINLGLITWFISQKYWADFFDKTITAYFTVGCWQVISMSLHAYMGWFTKKWNIRYIYHLITFIAVVTIPIGSFWILALTAVPMALFYSALCIVEFFKIEKRPLSLLK